MGVEGGVGVEAGVGVEVVMVMVVVAEVVMGVEVEVGVEVGVGAEVEVGVEVGVGVEVEVGVGVEVRVEVGMGKGWRQGVEARGGGKSPHISSPPSPTIERCNLPQPPYTRTWWWGRFLVSPHPPDSSCPTRLLEPKATAPARAGVPWGVGLEYVLKSPRHRRLLSSGAASHSHPYTRPRGGVDFRSHRVHRI